MKNKIETRSSKKLATILFSGYILPTTFLLLILSVVGMFIAYTHQSNLIDSNQKAIANQVSTVISDFIDEEYLGLENAAWFTDPIAQSAEKQKQILNTILGNQTNIQQVLLMNDKAEPLMSASRISSVASGQIDDLFHNEWLDNLKQGQRVMGTVYYSDISQEPLVIIAIPVMDSTREFTGILVAEINLKSMWGLVNSLKFGETGYVYIVDQKGNLLAYRDVTRVMKIENLSGVTTVADFLRSQNDEESQKIKLYRGIDGVYVVGSYTPLEISNWAVITEINWAEAYQGIIRLILYFLALLIVMSLLAIYLLQKQSQRLANPLVQLTKIATRIANGEKELQADIAGPIELAQLAFAFNSMTQQLRQSLSGLEQHVTELGKTQESLRFANQELQTIFDYSPAAIIVCDQNSVVSFWNKAAESIYGWTADEVVGIKLPYFSGNQYAEHLEIIKRIEKGNPITNFETQRTRKDGTVLSIYLSVSPQRDSQGKMARYVVLGTNITDKIKAQKALQESEKKFRLVVENTPAIIFIIDPQGIFQLCRGQGLAELNLRPEMLEGKSVYEDIQGLETITESLKKAMAGEVVRTNPGGWGDRAFNMVYSPYYDADGNLNAVIGVALDITEKVKAEEKLRSQEVLLAESQKVANLGYFTFNIRTGEWTSSPILDEIFGITKNYPHNIPGWKQIIHPEDREQVWNDQNEFGTKGEGIYDHVYRIVRVENGQVRWVYCRNKLQYDDNGKRVFALGIIQDITEQRQKEESLRIASYSLEHVSDGVQWIDQSGMIFWANQAACEMLGYTHEEIIGMKVSSFDLNVSDNDWPGIWEHSRQVINFQGLSKHITRDQRVFPVEIRSNFVKYQDKEFVCVFVQDVTEREKTEEKLRMSNYVMENAVTGVEWIDINGQILWVNRAEAEMMGYSQDQMVQMKIMDIDPNVTAENWPGLWKNAKANPYFTVERTHVTSDGRIIPIEINSNFFTYGDQEFLCSFTQDISERKKIEENLQLVSYSLEHVTDSVQWIDKDGNIMWVNQAACEMVGYTRDELTTMRISDIDPGLKYKSWAEVWEDVRNWITYSLEGQQLTKEGRIIPVEIRGNYVKYGEKEFVCALVHDITQRKENEDRIRRLNEDLERRVVERTEQLQAANKELEAFSYSVSHDLRAPLRAISGYTQILREDYQPLLDEEGQRVCSVISDESHRMGKLIDDLLSLSRLSRAEMQLFSVDMTSLANSVYLNLATPEERERIDFKVNPLPNAYADGTLIQQVWVNLISNAIKYSSKRECAVIEINGWIEGGNTVYSVHDNGAGFDMQYAGKLFGVFQRLHNQREFEGTGVGLAIVQRVINRHGGKVWAEGSVDVGASFYFSLPGNGGQHHE